MGNFLGPTQAGVGLDSDLLESGLRPGSACVARLARPAESAESAESDGWEYIYGTVTSLQPPCIHGCDGADYTADALRWVAAARDDGWLEPYGKEWREPGRAIFLRLLRDEWVTAFVGLTGPDMPFSYLPLEGVDGLPGVDVLKEVGMLFTPHEECREEFQHLEPGRGGFLADHLSKAFVLGSKSQQRLRWVKKCRSEPQYPMRCVFVHPRVKCRGLAEFVRRCHVKRAECPQEIAAEAVVLLGPPAAGKSSIQRLDAQQLPQELRHTVESLKYREEVNNDNLTDCMPGFEKEFRVALQMPKESQAGGAHWRKMLKVVKRDTRSLAWAAQALKDKSEEYKSAIAWAIQWLTYAMFHHGPVRDSLAWDIIKVSIVDAAELPVFYSSVMAGAAIDRTMEVLELAHSGAADKKGHFHAQQAEENITKMLKSLKLGQKPTDCGDTNISTEVKVDHFVVIDNDAPQPRVLLRFNEQCAQCRELCEQQEREAARKLLDIIREVPEWGDVCRAAFRCAQFFLPDSDVDALACRAGEGSELEAPEQVLPLLQHLDEAVFQILMKDSPAISTCDLRPAFSHVENAELQRMSLEQLRALKEHFTNLRMMCVVRALQDEGEDSEEAMSPS
ncbi:unnamed protein product [Effrenium voratum]|nr:unnamed protein product [Effrenium voratum]